MKVNWIEEKPFTELCIDQNKLEKDGEKKISLNMEVSSVNEDEVKVALKGSLKRQMAIP